MKRKYSPLLTPVMWCFFPGFYRDVAVRWKGICALYLLGLMAVVCIPPIVQATRGYDEFLSAEGQELIDQVPPIEINAGEVSSPVDQPYAIDLPGADREMAPFEHLAVLDTTGQITSIEEARAPVLLTRTHLISQDGQGQIRMFPLHDVDDFRMDHSDVHRWAQSLGKWLPWLLYPTFVVGAFIGRLVQILLYGVVGLLLAAMCGAKLKYSATVRLAAVAITPIVLADAILGLAGVPLGVVWTWGGIAIAIGLLLFGVVVNREFPQPPAQDEESPSAASPSESFSTPPVPPPVP